MPMSPVSCQMLCLISLDKSFHFYFHFFNTFSKYILLAWVRVKMYLIYFEPQVIHFINYELAFWPRICWLGSQSELNGIILWLGYLKWDCNWSLWLFSGTLFWTINQVKPHYASLYFSDCLILLRHARLFFCDKIHCPFLKLVWT